MTDVQFMRLALTLARRALGQTSPNPMVGAVLVKNGKIIGRGWHRRAGGAHAEIEALRDVRAKGNDPKGATLFVTLEPCCTHGRTPPCTEAIIAAGIGRVVVGATDPNTQHAGKGFRILRRAGIEVERWGKAADEPPPAGEHHGSRGRSPGQKWSDECSKMNEAFNHWIVRRTPLVTVKAAMTLDGKIATKTGESKWITGEAARALGMKLRQGADAILVGINTILTDDPSLIFRGIKKAKLKIKNARRRIILDSRGKTPLTAKVVSDELRGLTTIVVTKAAPQKRVAALANRVNVLIAPAAKSKIKNQKSQIDLRWLLKTLGAQEVTSLLVEGGGEVNASFLLGGLAQRVAFFYAPTILGGRDSRKGVAGDGARRLGDMIQLREVAWRRVGPDLLLTARVG
jgi:diaminohydroxyphosphoribosylaminopyrimidine deaminase/5-amino-6-(5-phosphoribosylamino)uracil reductase